ncbi:hypothetical protein D3C80_576590 [compost metagenome]
MLIRRRPLRSPLRMELNMSFLKMKQVERQVVAAVESFLMKLKQHIFLPKLPIRQEHL